MKEKLIYNNSTFDSTDEVYFAIWLSELQSNGYIDKWLRNEKSYEIAEPVYNEYVKETQLKTKIKTEYKKQILLNKYSYTPDFLIWWNKSAKDLFYNELNANKEIKCLFVINEKDDPFSIVEVKPSFDKSNMTRLFRHTQKIYYKLYGDLISLVEYSKLFAETFTPREYLKTPTGKDRKISKWKVKTLEQFLNDRSTK